MQAQYIAWTRARPLWIQATVGVLAALAAVYLLPLMLVPEAGFDDAESRLKAENDLRTTLVQAAGGAIVLLATWRTLHVNREGQITERFTRAIDQLGEEKLDVRLGGIYALERIARDSKSDRGPIIEVLTAFLREHARWNPKHHQDAPAVTARGRAGSGQEQGQRLRADFQAIATVIGRNRWSEEHHFDLREVDLRDANLSGAHLEEAALSGAHLEGAFLDGANLEKADLTGAHLERVTLAGAHLERATLGAAHLEWADLRGAYLQGVFLGAAHMERADLTGAHLVWTYLRGAYLEQAELGGAHLEWADLHSADLKSANLSGAHLEEANLSRAHLEEADLGGAHLEEADLRGAHLEGANLRGAHLDGANLQGANLDGADVTGAFGLAL